MKQNIIIIYGGKSVEHDISILTALQTYENVDKSKYNCMLVYMDKSNKLYIGNNLKELSFYKNIDYKKLTEVCFFSGNSGLHKIKRNRTKEIFDNFVAITCCHGSYGEDGLLVGVFELSQIPYTSSNTLSLALAQDKYFMKQIFEKNNFNIVKYLEINENEWTKSTKKVVSDIEKNIEYPLIIKPNKLGSSIGISKVNNFNELIRAVEFAFNFDNKVIIEKCVVPLREFNCAAIIINGEVVTSDIEEPIIKSGILSFENKYLSGSKTKNNKRLKVSKNEDNQKTDNSNGMASLSRILPAKIDNNLVLQIENTTKIIYNCFGCSGVIRVDYLFNGTELFVNEINSIPGSLAYYLFESKGIKFSDLIDNIVSNAIKSKNQSDKLVRNFDSSVL